jgi:hypothetical protein
MEDAQTVVVLNKLSFSPGTNSFLKKKRLFVAKLYLVFAVKVGWLYSGFLYSKRTSKMGLLLLVVNY